MYDLYNLIKDVCEAKGVTVSGMCVELKISKGIMSDLKNGRKKTLSALTLSKIADYLDVSVDYLLTGEQKETPSAPKNDGGNVFELAIKNLCGDDQKKLALLMDSLSKNPEKTKASFDLFLKTL